MIKDIESHVRLSHKIGKMNGLDKRDQAIWSEYRRLHKEHGREVALELLRLQIKDYTLKVFAASKLSEAKACIDHIDLLLKVAKVIKLT